MYFLVYNKEKLRFYSELNTIIAESYEFSIDEYDDFHKFRC